MTDTMESGAYRYRKLNWAEYKTLRKIQQESGIEDGIGYALYAAIVGPDGGRLFKSVEEAETAISCDDALELFDKIRILSGLILPEELEKNLKS